MAIDFSALDIRTKIPTPKTGLIAVLPAPCLRERMHAADALVKALKIRVAGSGDVPHGFAVGGPNGQIEIFAASGAVRARNTDQLSRFEDERRPWTDVVKDKSDNGVVYRLGERTAKNLEAQARRLFDELRFEAQPAVTRVELGQWARLDESGKEVESGPGRATVQYSYAVEGTPLIGAGAKTNVHFDPDGKDSGGIIARFFHVHRGFELAKEIRLFDLERALEPLLTQTWSGLESKSGRTRITITAAKFGLLALPADVPQRIAAPALQVEGHVSGLVARSDEEVTIRFGQYLPLAEPKALASAGYGTAGAIIPGQLIGRGRKVEMA
jgi:hypothetical protein